MCVGHDKVIRLAIENAKLVAWDIAAFLPTNSWFQFTHLEWRDVSSHLGELIREGTCTDMHDACKCA
jgi:hypothetical protein